MPSKTTLKAATSPETTYCHHLGGLVTALDRVVRIPELIKGFCLTASRTIVTMAKTLMILKNLIGNKQVPATVVSVARKPWPEPDPDRFSSTKILWGFWNSGREAMPGFCQFAVGTWQARHPDWEVVIMSNANFREYVSPAELPTTFESLKVQHQSDILRLSVLSRYGGAYLDVSTIVFKSFDDIWAQAKPHQLFLTPALLLGDQTESYKYYLPNNALLFAPHRGNRVLSEWQLWDSYPTIHRHT